MPTLSPTTPLVPASSLSKFLDTATPHQKVIVENYTLQRGRVMLEQFSSLRAVSSCSTLTPQQARQLAAVLITAAHQADAELEAA